MIVLTYRFSSTLEARAFASHIRNKGQTFHSKLLRFPHTKVFRNEKEVCISHDETKNPKFFEVLDGKSGYYKKKSFSDEIEYLAKKFKGEKI